MNWISGLEMWGKYNRSGKAGGFPSLIISLWVFRGRGPPTSEHSLLGAALKILKENIKYVQFFFPGDQILFRARSSGEIRTGFRFPSSVSFWFPIRNSLLHLMCICITVKHKMIVDIFEGSWGFYLHNTFSTSKWMFIVRQRDFPSIFPALSYLKILSYS